MMIIADLILLYALTGPGPQADTSGTALMWPPPPERARVVHVRTIASPADLRPDRGFFENLTKFLFGGEDSRPWLVQPVGIAVSREGVIAVADPGAQGVHIVDLTEKRYRLLTERTSGMLGAPVGVAFGPEGRLYVSDSRDHLIAVYDEDFDPDGLLGTDLVHPTGIAVVNDTVFVTDTGRHAIACFDRSGTLLGMMGERGNGPGQFNFPVQLVSDGTLFVVDALNHRIQRLSHGGAALSSFGRLGTGPGSFANPKAIARDSEGHLYITDALLDNFQIYDTAGQLLLVVGRKGLSDGEFMSPSGIAIDGENMIYVVDSLNRRIQIFRYLP